MYSSTAGKNINRKQGRCLQVESGSVDLNQAGQSQQTAVPSQLAPNRVPERLWFGQRAARRTAT